MNVQLLQHHLFKGLYFLHWNTFEHSSKMVFLWLFILFYWSVSILSMKLQCLNNLVFSYALVNYSLTDFLLTGVWVTERKVLELQTKIVGLFILRSLLYLLRSLSRTWLKQRTHTNTSNVDFLWPVNSISLTLFIQSEICIVSGVFKICLKCYWYGWIKLCHVLLFSVFKVIFLIIIFLWV